MVNHCANPACHKSLHYLRDGKVFLFSKGKNSDSGKSPQRLEHFWLCGACAKVFTLSMDGNNSIQLLPAKRSRRGQVPGSSYAPVS